MLKKSFKALFMIGATVGEWLAVVAGVNGNERCWNLAVFLFWLLFVASVLAALPPNKPQPATFKWSPWLSAISDAGIALLLASYGHFFYAWLVVVQQLLERSIVKIGGPMEPGEVKTGCVSKKVN